MPSERRNSWSPWRGLDPHRRLAELRSEGPIVWAPEFGAWVVTTHDLCTSVLRDAAAFTVDREDFSTRQVIGPSMLSLDGPEHRRHRSAFAQPFRARPVREQLTHWVSTEAKSAIRAIGPRGSGDLRALLAAPLAAKVMRKVLGLEGVSLDQLNQWNRLITAAIDEVTLGGPVPEWGRRAFGALREAVEHNVDTGTGLVGRVGNNGSLEIDEVVANVAVLLLGGVVTSEGTVAICLHHLLSHPEALERVREDLDLVPHALEESMRLEPAAAFVDRYATRATRIEGARVGAGDLVRVSISAANRDPSVFEEPDTFDIDRPNAADHIAFARGPHACLGIHVARLEARAAVTAALGGLVGLRSGDQSPVPEGLIFRAPPSVPAIWAGDSSTPS